MATINAAEVTRFPIPHEPGEWVDLRRLSGGQLRKLGSRIGSTDIVIEGLVLAVAGWSYPLTVGAESIESLDARTFTWLLDLSNRHTAGELSDNEKKDATSRSTDCSTANAGSMPTSSNAGS